MTNERMARSMCAVDRCALTHSHILTFRDKLQGAAEHSEAWQSFGWPIVQELMAQAVATPAATNLGRINQDTYNINSHTCTLPQHTKPSLPGCDCTFTGPQASGSLLTLSSWMVLEKAGQGEECSNLDALENNSCPHSEHTYIPERTKMKAHNLWHLSPKALTSCFFYYSPASKWFLYSSPPEKGQYDISAI